MFGTAKADWHRIPGSENPEWGDMLLEHFQQEPSIKAMLPENPTADDLYSLVAENRSTNEQALAQRSHAVPKEQIGMFRQPVAPRVRSARRRHKGYMPGMETPAAPQPETPAFPTQARPAGTADLGMLEPARPEPIRVGDIVRVNGTQLEVRSIAPTGELVLADGSQVAPGTVDRVAQQNALFQAPTDLANWTRSNSPTAWARL